MRNLNYFFPILFTGCLQVLNAQDFPQLNPLRPNDDLTVYLNYTLAICPESCDGQVTAVVDGGQPPYSYSWSNGAATSEIHDLCPGSGEVTITDNSGNTATAMYEIDVYPVPIAILDTVYITQPTDGLNNGCIAVDSAMVIDTTFFPIDTVWSIDSMNFTPFHSFCHLGPGIYRLYLRTWEGCIFPATGDIILYDITGIENAKFSYSLYPNPVTTDLQLHTDLPVSIELMDLHGRLLFKENAKGDHIIEMSSFPEGIYILKISDGEKFAFKKIVKTGD